MYRLDYLPLCTIAGSDPTGGAGLQADLRTFAAHGGHGSAVVTALTVQDEDGVQAVEPVAPARVAAQLEAVLRAAPPLAMKTGMLATAKILDAVAGVLDRAGAPPLVVDPVLEAGAGGVLLEEEGVAALTRRLAPHAALVTPNLPEAARLLGRTAVGTDGAEDAARDLVARGWRAVLLKGGHAPGEEIVDVLADGEGTRAFRAPRVHAGSVHGTGCALSASIAARLGRGDDLEAAVAGAIAYVRRLIEAAGSSGSWLLPHLSVEP